MDTADSPGFDAESRELAVARWLIGAGGRAVVDALPRYRREEALALAARLRTEGLDADRTAAALTLSRLRTRATAKFGERAGSMFFTAAGYEQATRLSVGALHAERFLAAGARRIVDFGCGVGADSLAFCLAGLDVTAIEVDPVAALYAAANAPRAAVVCADGLATRLPEADGIWLDPSRRTGDGRRIASPEGWAPPLSRALSIAGGFPVAGIKAAPGIAHDALPAGALVEWVSEAGQLLEAVVWLGVGAGRAAVVDGEAFDSGASAADEPVSFVKPREIGPILLEPDPAVIRSGGIARLCERYGVAPVSGGVAYLSGEATPPHCSAFEVLDVLIPEVKRIKRALAAAGRSSRGESTPRTARRDGPEHRDEAAVAQSSRVCRRAGRLAHGRHMTTRFKSIPVSTVMSRPEGATPLRTSSQPSEAIIAPLSVQYRMGGILRATPAFAARSAASSRRRELAEKPPPITRASQSNASQATRALAVRTSQIASEKLAATSSPFRSSPRSATPST